MTMLRKLPTSLTDGRILKFIFLTVAVLTAFDVVQDYEDGANFFHLLIELSVIFACFFGFIILWNGFQRRIERLSKDVKTQKEEASHWKLNSQKYVQGLSTEIERQFQQWSFTDVEKEIGFLLLKGLSFKEIADVCQKKERTVRQQALEIYKKSQLNGRAEFSAYFLEDLLPPLERFSRNSI